jgi:hypothetical protein
MRQTAGCGGTSISEKRGRENEALKLAMYLVKRSCDRTLPAMAEYFGTASYSAVSWGCRAIESKLAREKKLRHRIEKTIASMHQLQTCPQLPHSRAESGIAPLSLTIPIVIAGGENKRAPNVGKWPRL